MKSTKTLFSLITLLCLFSFGFLWSNIEKYSVDYTNPENIVIAASKMLLNCDYTTMTLVTEGTEKKRTEETIASIKGNNAVYTRLKAESDQIHSYEILSSEIFSNVNLAVVHTKWQIKIENMKTSPYASTEEIKEARKFSIVYVDYLLKLTNNKWLIIAKQTR